jgi:hypothetical protein
MERFGGGSVSHGRWRRLGASDCFMNPTEMCAAAVASSLRQKTL